MAAASHQIRTATAADAPDMSEMGFVAVRDQWHGRERTIVMEKPLVAPLVA